MARISLVSSSLEKGDRLGINGCEYFQPPLNLCMLAASLRQMGHAVQIVDPEPLGLTTSETTARIISFEPNCVGFSSTTFSISAIAKIAAQCQRLKITTILGGNHVTAKPLKTMQRFEGFDFALLGEADLTLPKLVGELKRNRKSPKDVEGLVSRCGERLRETPRGSFVRNLDALPLPAVDLLPDITSYYQPKFKTVHPLPVFPIVTSRGCQTPSMMCDRTMFGLQKRSHGPYYIYRLISHLTNRYGIRHILVRDQTFLAEKETVLSLCEMLSESLQDLTWSCFTRADLVDPKILPAMRKAGCTRLIIGYQPGSQTVIDSMNIGMNVECIPVAVKQAKAHGFMVKGDFFIGGFGETGETIEETCRLVHQLPLDDFTLTMFRPLPGSEAYEIASQFGKACTDWDRCGTEYFIPNGFTSEQLERAYWRVFRSFHLKPHRLFWPLKSPSGTFGNIRKMSKAGLSILRPPRNLEEY